MCLCLLSLASNWIFCPEFSAPLCRRKASEGYNSERSRTFYVSPSHLRNKKTSPDWKDQNTCLRLCIHPCKGTSHHITPFSASVKCVGLRCFWWFKEENQLLSQLIQAARRARGQGGFIRAHFSQTFSGIPWLFESGNVNHLLPSPRRSFITLFELWVSETVVFFPWAEPYFKFPALQELWGSRPEKLANAVPSLLEFVAVSKWGQKINSVPQITGRRISLHGLTDRCSLPPTSFPSSQLLLHPCLTSFLSPHHLFLLHPSLTLILWPATAAPPDLSPSCLFPPLFL